MARIVGGTNSGVGEFPWRVSLYSIQLGVFCGGTIISKNYVLTAVRGTQKKTNQNLESNILHSGSLYKFDRSW